MFLWIKGQKQSKLERAFSLSHLFQKQVEANEENRIPKVRPWQGLQGVEVLAPSCPHVQGRCAWEPEHPSAYTSDTSLCARGVGLLVLFICGLKNPQQFELRVPANARSTLWGPHLVFQQNLHLSLDVLLSVFYLG